MGFWWFHAANRTLQKAEDAAPSLSGGRRAGLSHSGEVGEGGGFGFEGRDGVDQASDGESVANASGAADETKEAAFTSELDGDADEGREAGAVDLRNTIEDHDDFSGAAVDHGLEGVVELFTGFANG
jgi:hypothetical protein